MNINNLFSILTILGVGTALGTYLRILWERKNNAQLQKQDFKFGRYKVIILLMYGCINFDKDKKKLQEHGRFFNTIEDVLEELKTEWHNMILFASEGTLKTLQDFILIPDKNNFYKCARAMREDLWDNKISLSIKDIKL